MSQSVRTTVPRWAPIGMALAGVLAVGSASPALAADTAVTVSDVDFVLGAQVLDGGQQVTSVTLDTDGLGAVDPASLTTDTFTVHATSTNPVPGLNPGLLFSLYDLDRVVTGVTVDATGDVVVDLQHGRGVPGASTLAYSVQAGRNVVLDLEYTVTQDAPIRLLDGTSVTLTDLEQGALVDPEVDRFAAGETADGLRYRLYTPERVKRNGKHPLVVWLHGNGEGGLPGQYSNEPQLTANRGALGFTTPEAQEIFKGAYVLAPQVPTTWYDLEVADYAERVKALVDDLAGSLEVDQDRIYIAGASAGGFMTVQMVTRYPDTFAAAVPVAPAISFPPTGGEVIGDEQLLRMNSTPSWFIHATNDRIVPVGTTSLRAHELLDNSLLTTYDSVVWDGVEYNGHWSWIYSARNDPTTDKGRSLLEWMSRQNLKYPHGMK